MKYTSPYVAPTLVVDAVIMQIIDNVLHVLLVRRSKEPFQGSWALLGGYCPAGETTLEALERISLEKAGLPLRKQVRYIEQLYTFDTVARDPRGHAVAVTYLGIGMNMQLSTGSETTQFFPVDQLPDMAYDHVDIINKAHDRLKAKITYTNAVYAMLPEHFTLTQLQTTYEAILGRPLDKRNFRKKFLQLDLIEGTNQKQADGAHRPAQLFRFKQQSLHSLTRSFD